MNVEMRLQANIDSRRALAKQGWAEMMAFYHLSQPEDGIEFDAWEDAYLRIKNIFSQLAE